jgi:hypothetical protein
LSQNHKKSILDFELFSNQTVTSFVTRNFELFDGHVFKDFFFAISNGTIMNGIVGDSINVTNNLWNVGEVSYRRSKPLEKLEK